MALASYSFYLLESIFLCHVWGLQHKLNTVTSQRKTETSMNMQFFSSSHVRELAARYDSDKFNILKYQTRRGKAYAIEMNAVKKKTTWVKQGNRYGKLSWASRIFFYNLWSQFDAKSSEKTYFDLQEIYVLNNLLNKAEMWWYI